MRDSVCFFRPVWTLLALIAVACREPTTAPEAVEHPHGTAANNIFAFAGTYQSELLYFNGSSWATVGTLPLYYTMAVPTEFIVGAVPPRFMLHMASMVAGGRTKGSVRKARTSLDASRMQPSRLGNPIDAPDATMLCRYRT